MSTTYVKSRPLSEHDALESIRDRLERAFGLLHPGELTDDERHGLAQHIWFALDDANRGLGDLYWPGPSPDEAPA